MARIDSHQHFWKFDPVRDSWIDAPMAAIQRDFFPSDLGPILRANGFDGCVAVQSDQSLHENDFHLELADKYDFIKGIVGWIDLQAEDIAEQLGRYRELRKLKGFRHVLQGEPQRDFMLRPAFKRGVAALKNFGYTYDILIYPDQLGFAKTFVASFPDQPFVVDHLAKPDIKARNLEGWKTAMLALAEHQNVFCKISGMVTEASWTHWKKEDFRPYIDAVVQGFGVNRLMFGSDWPVCLVAATYGEAVDLVKDYFSSFTNTEQSALFGGTATRFYKL